ncbi:hypothetical protein PBY51_018597 [Eleginops maclovinus]|uniref:Uncharacterized protein n=1 Tax=Eleginops maclovinus TaxID=56733 RepID=A0AAN8AYB5_ELEMC|nr:hypothetical protein PBY51_018597 [Eleginops maclovinus]
MGNEVMSWSDLFPLVPQRCPQPRKATASRGGAFLPRRCSRREKAVMRKMLIQWLEILHLASLMRDQGDQRRGQLRLWRAKENAVLGKETEELGGERGQEEGDGGRSERNVKDVVYGSREGA